MRTMDFITLLLTSLRQRRLSVSLVVAVLISVLGSGCAALTNPGVQAIPVRLLPSELRGQSVAGLKPIPLALLGQDNPPNYLIDGGDVLGVWVEGILGERGQQPPVLPQPIRLNDVDLPPATGFPIQVNKDGTISLPQLGSLRVAGMTFKEAEDAIRKAYEDRQILQPGRARILVSLIRPRTYHVLVLRQDSPMPVQTFVTSQLGGGGPEFLGASRKGTGWDLILPAYQNDVLTALAKSGGLPGTDADDKAIVERNGLRSRSRNMLIQNFQANGAPTPLPGCPIQEIPLRQKPGTPLAIRSEDVILHDGDVVFIPAREERLFFTGGLLPSGEHILPRDHDLDVLEAVARVRGVMFSGNFAVSNFFGNLLLPGMGQPSATLLTIVRKLPHCGQVNIRVDLAKAVKDPRERILVQAGDFLMLQETPGQAVTRYASQVFDVPFYWVWARSSRTFGGMGFSMPGGQAPQTITPLTASTYQGGTFPLGASATTIQPVQTSTVTSPVAVPAGR